MRHTWAGHYLDGRTPVRQPVTVRLMAEGLEIGGAAETRFWPYREIRQTQGFYADEEVRLERGGELPETLLIAERGFLESLEQIAPGTTSRIHHPARRGRRLQLTVLAGLAAIGIVAALYLWGIPMLAAVVAPRVPVAWEESLGRSVVDHLAPAARRCADPRRQAALDGILARLTAAAPGSPYAFRLVVVDAPAVNAFAAPGGFVVVARGLLEQTRAPEELAGVLAHELQHVLHRDVTRGLIQHASTGLLLAALTGDMTGPLAYGLQSARVLGQLRYSRAAEDEADADGIKMLVAARVDPAGMIRLFDMLAGEEARPPAALQYLSTHPSTEDRIARLSALAREIESGPARPLLPEADWNDVKRICERSPARGP